VTRWAARTREVFEGLAGSGGVLLRSGRELLRTPAPNPWWAAAVPDLRRLTAAELPPGFADGFSFVAPVVDMGRYLAWLVGRLATLDVAVAVAVRRIADWPSSRATWSSTAASSAPGNSWVTGPLFPSAVRWSG